MGVIVILVIGLAVVITALVLLLTGGPSGLPGLQAYRGPSDPLLVISTRTPTPTSIHTPTRTRIVVAPPTRRATLTATFTLAPSSTPTPTPTVTSAAETDNNRSTPTLTSTTKPLPTETPAPPTLMPTPSVLMVGDPVRLRAGPGKNYDTVGYARKGETLPLMGRTANGEYWQVSSGGRVAWVLANLAEAQAGADAVPVVHELPPTPTPTPTVTATPTPTPTPLPAPVLLEPSAGAVFEDKVRYKFTWFRRLQWDEKFSVYVRSSDGSADFDWWVSERDILDAGGAIHAVPGAFLYEVNSGLGTIPSGEAYWRVAVFDDTPGAQRIVSPWSAERRIYKK